MPLRHRQYHLVGFVDHRIAFDSAQEQVLVVVLGLADRVSVGGKVADSVDKPVAVLADVGQIRGIPVPRLEVIQHPGIILPLGIAHLFLLPWMLQVRMPR